jgi:type VI secretion system secreted protein Hcp
MSVDLFLKMDGIMGEATDKAHQGQIVLESFSWGESSAVAHFAAGSGAGAGAGKVSMQDFHFTARVSIATPKLMLACASGQHIPTAVMSARKSSDEQVQSDFLVYKLSNVIVTSVQQAGNNELPPLDAVSLAFQKVLVEYKEQRADGSLSAPISFGWDLSANKKI